MSGEPRDYVVTYDPDAIRLVCCNWSRCPACRTQAGHVVATIPGSNVTVTQLAHLVDLHERTITGG